MQRALRAFLKDESGATFIEYGILVGFIGVGIIVAATDLVAILVGLLADLGAAMNAVNP